MGRRSLVGLVLLLWVAGCAAPPTATPIPATATPNGVQTALAQLTQSFAPLTPSPSETAAGTATPTRPPDTPTPPGSPTVAATGTNTASAAPTATLVPSATPTLATTTPTARAGARVSATPTLSLTATPITPTATLTPTTLAPIGPGNASSLTQVALLAQAAVAPGATVSPSATVSGTPPAKLDQVAWAPDGTLAAAGSAGVLFAQGEVLTASRGYTMGVWVPSLSFSSDNRALALSSVGGTVRLFDRADGSLLFQLVQPGLRVAQVRYRPGAPGVLAQYLASLGADNTVYVWDVAYRKFLGALRPGPSSAEALEISGDGRWLAATSGNAVLVWDMNSLPSEGWTGSITPTLTLSQPAAVSGLALSPDGALLAASNGGGSVELWSLATGQPLAIFARPGGLPGRLAISPNGRLVAAAYSDLAIRVWSYAQPARPLAVLTGHQDRITSLAFSPDGKVLASSSWDGTLREWAVVGK